MYYIFSLPLILLALFHSVQSGISNNSEELIEAVETILKDRYPHMQSNLQVRVIRTGGAINLNGSFDIFFPEASEVPRAHQRIEVHNHAQNKSGWALIYIAHYDSVLTVNRSMKNDEQVTWHDINTIWAETTRFRGEPMTPDLIRKMFATGDVFANRFVAEDRILKRRDLRNAFDVSTGQSVSMHYQRSGITLSLTCKARNQGFTGDLIKLYSPDTQLMYKARITGPGVAAWVETLH